MALTHSRQNQTFIIVIFFFFTAVSPFFLPLSDSRVAQTPPNVTFFFFTAVHFICTGMLKELFKHASVLSHAPWPHKLCGSYIRL